MPLGRKRKGKKKGVAASATGKAAKTPKPTREDKALMGLTQDSVEVRAKRFVEDMESARKQPKEGKRRAVDGAAKQKARLLDQRGLVQRSTGQPLTMPEASLVVSMTIKLITSPFSTLASGVSYISGAWKGLTAVFDTVVALTGISRSTVGGCFKSFCESDGEFIELSDPSNRGRGSPSVDRVSLRKLKPAQLEAIEKFCEHRNDNEGFVSLMKLMLYMEFGPMEDTDEPPLADGLKVAISRSSLSYIMRKHLGYEYRYTKKKGVLMKGIKRQMRMRRFAIELARAKNLEAKGTHILVWTDESYIHQNHAPLTSWTKEGTGGAIGRTSSKGKRLIFLHAITKDGPLVTRDNNNTPIVEGGMSMEPMKEELTAEWIWPSKTKNKDYHESMDGHEFERWLKCRLIPTFKQNYPNKKMILIMDNAPYHHQLCRDYFPEGKTPNNCTKELLAHILRTAYREKINSSGAGATRGNNPNRWPLKLKVNRGGETHEFDVPEDEPMANSKHRNGVRGAKAVQTGAAGTVYCRYPRGPSTEELQVAAKGWLKANVPEALDSKVERLFRDEGWSIVWTPPYCPTFQPIEEFWGGGKQRAGIMYKPGRTLEQVKVHLRNGWYGAPKKSWHDGKKRDALNCADLIRRSDGAVNAWIAKDIKYNENGLTGTLSNLGNVSEWTDTGKLDDRGEPLDWPTYLNINDMNDGVEEEEEEEEEEDIEEEEEGQ